jgi:hypothetical protein
LEEKPQYNDENEQKCLRVQNFNNFLLFLFFNHKHFAGKALKKFFAVSGFGLHN